jgi:nitrous oxide reductase accessory protein NosL
MSRENRENRAERRTGAALRDAARALLVLTAACGKTERLDPPLVHYGEDFCAQCNMIVNEERFATASITEAQGESPSPRLFDDIICQFAFEGTHPNEVVRRRFAHDAATSEWFDASAGFFVKCDAVRSPMGGSVLAAQTKHRADSLAAKCASRAVPLEELRAAFAKGD